MPFQSGRRYDFWNTEWKEVGAVYGILSLRDGVIYVGQTDNLKERMASHRSNSDHCLHRHWPTWVIVEVIGNKVGRLLRERQLIQEFDPPCNKV
jgi:predicted GIY-YIG superfamily endonuclease